MNKNQSDKGIEPALQFVMGIVTGVIAIPLIWLPFIFLIDPVCQTFLYAGAPIPIPVWYGSWLLTLITNFAFYLFVRSKLAIFAKVFIVVATVLSIPHLFMMWFALNLD